MANIQWTRRLIQAGSLYFLGTFSYYGIFRCPFAVPYVSCENCPVVQCPGRKLWLITWIGILLSALIFGRAFCSHACPGGMVAELLSRVALLKGKIRKTLDKKLSYIKYGMLAASVYLVWIMHNPRWAVPIRTGEFFPSTTLTFEHAFPLWFVRTFFVVGALALGILIPHFWCRYLCPTGALLEPFRKFSFYGYSMNASCTDCGKCNRHCDLETRPHEQNCTNCGACKPVCPVDAIHIERITTTSSSTQTTTQ
ncbi:4Fe-4S binding protein [Desulfovibrio inopinatus]|uniref:4Fe-4S binding protein n=1 Tax=Desulfovibrio inopinatus TaxID=102109 RepID=UPI00041FF605|nr:4Fe-4S binding protein [Desulfovibrio inopinatus]